MMPILAISDFAWISLAVSAAVILLVPLIGSLIAMRHYRITFLQGFWLWLNAVFNRLRWHTRVDRPMAIGPDQGAVIIANHRSGFDPMFLQLAAPRMIHWMVAKEYCVNHWLAWFFRLLEAIPAGRGGIDTAAVKQAIRMAASGKLVGMMPEGRINESNDLLLPGRPGAALVALRARVPVIPCHISGAPYNGTTIGPLFMSARVKVTVGDPIDLSEFYGREREPGVTEELTKRFLKEIVRLGGVPDFEPQVAGRRWKPDDLEESEEPEAPPAGLKRPA
jgi:1-acyl-sn-glycerol-3-phosphate acyltransferase